MGRLDSSFHPTLSKLIGCNVLSSTTLYNRLDTAAACLLDHSYSSEPIFSKPQQVRKSAKESTIDQLPPIPSRDQKSAKPDPFYVDPRSLETPSRLRVRKSVSPTPSTDSVVTLSKTKSKVATNAQQKQKISLEKRRRMEQRNRLQQQRRKEQERRKKEQAQATKKLSSMVVSRRSSAQSVQSPLSASAPIGSLTNPSGSLPPTPVGSGGFDIDNVVIPPPTPAALLAAAQALAESSSVDIATPGFRRVKIEPLMKSSSRGSTSKSKSRLSREISVETSSSSSSSLATDVFVPNAVCTYEDTDELAYRRRHTPIEHQERARYLAIMQHTIAPRKIRDMAVGARPPSQSGKNLSRSLDERPRFVYHFDYLFLFYLYYSYFRRSSRGTTSNAVIDPECKPFDFPLSETQWRTICAEKAATVASKLV